MNLSTKVRPKTLYVTNETYYALKAISDVEGQSCADEVAEQMLGEILARDPRNARRVKLFAEAMKEIDRRLRDEFEDKP